MNAADGAAAAEQRVLGRPRPRPAEPTRARLARATSAVDCGDRRRAQRATLCAPVQSRCRSNALRCAPSAAADRRAALHSPHRLTAHNSHTPQCCILSSSHTFHALLIIERFSISFFFIIWHNHVVKLSLSSEF